MRFLVLSLEYIIELLQAKKIRKGHVTVEGFLEYRWLFFNCIVAVVVGFSFQLMSDFFQC